MVRDIQEIPDDNDFIINIRSSVYRYPIKLWVSLEDTVLSLKEYMGERMERYLDELTIVINQSCPYPLPDEMRLSKLLEEHRNLLLLSHEGNEEPYGRPDTRPREFSVWWSQCVPQRYFTQKETQEWDRDLEEWKPVLKEILDFRFIAKESIPHIRSWLYATRNVSEIWLLGTHPYVNEIIQHIAEDVLSLPCLTLISIQHPMNPDFQIPPKSNERISHTEIKRTHLERSALVYLYQHLALDQYRHSTELIEIWIDAGLLGNKETRRFFPDSS